MSSSSSSNDENPFDDIKAKKFLRKNPWQGKKPEFGYVPITSIPSSENFGFYWIWPCIKNPNAPILVQHVGGPGCCVMDVAFDEYAPVNVDEDKCWIKKNPKALTDKFNLMYLESPVGSGFSQAKKSIQNFDEDNLAALDVFNHVLEKHPEWRNSKWFYHGTSYCGLSIPHNLVFLREKLNLDFKGLILYVPQLNNDMQYVAMDYWEIQSEYKVWINKFEKSFFWFYYKFVDILRNKKLISDDTFEDFVFWPLNNKKYKNSDGEMESVDDTCNLCNFHKKDDSKSGGSGSDGSGSDSGSGWGTEAFVNSKLFHELIKSKKNDGDDDNITIYDTDPYCSSLECMKNIIESGIETLILNGEGDLILPPKGLFRAFSKIGFSWQDDWNKLEFSKKSDIQQVKKMKNLTWIRLDGAGHNPDGDHPEACSEILRNFLKELTPENEQSEEWEEDEES